MQLHQWPATLARYNAGVEWLESLITDPRGERYLVPHTQDDFRRTQQESVERTARFLAYLGNPQKSYHIAHIAGTGGKGSVATMLEAILRASVGAGTTGLHTSPYIQVPNEKLISGGKMIKPSDFTNLIAEFRALYESYVEKHPYGRPKYGEAWVALTHFYFQQAGVSWVSLETGMGGRFDPTNVCDPAVSIITNVDFDHVPQLGTTIPEIAWHKAGIIKLGRPVVTGETKLEALNVIRREAERMGAPLLEIGRDYAAENIRHNTSGVIADIRTPYGQISDLHISLLGAYQATNAATAITAAQLLAQQYSLPISEGTIREAMGSLIIHGRLEIMQHEPLAVIDGAHNPQKMRSAAAALQQEYPHLSKLLVIGMLSTKDAPASLAAILPTVDRVIATQPTVIGKPSIPAQEIAALISRLRPGIPITVESGAATAMRQALALAQPGEMVFATGSIYMLGQVREVWWPKEELLKGLERE